MLSNVYLDLISELLPGILCDDAKNRLSLLFDCIVETNERINITSLTSPIDVSLKHFADSLSLFLNPLFSKMTERSPRVCDVGCGGGFPGLPLACVRPDLSLTMIDSTEKKISALQKNAEHLGLSCVIPVCGRGEDLAGKGGAYRGKYDVCISRAVARLPVLLELCLPFLKKGGVFFAMKGVMTQEELNESRRAISTLGAELVELHRISFPSIDTTSLSLSKEEHESLSDFISSSRYLIVVRKKADTPIKFPRAWAQMKNNPL